MVAAIMTDINAILQEINKVIRGKEKAVAHTMMALLAGGHVLLDDVPGVGKTTLALAIRTVLGLDYRRVQFTPDTTPADITGYNFFNNQTGEFVYQAGAAMTNLLLADEINRTSSKTQAALLEVMAEGQVSVDGQTYPVPEPFFVIGTQNPVGSVGTQMLPAAQLDRFMVRISLGYPEFTEEVAVLKDREKDNPLQQIAVLSSPDEVLSMQAAVRDIYVADDIYEYITRIVTATRSHEAIRLGVSTRGGLSLAQMARAGAFLAGRDYVTPEDVLEIVDETLAHRLILNAKAKMQEYSAKQLLGEITGRLQVTGSRTK